MKEQYFSPRHLFFSFLLYAHFVRTNLQRGRIVHCVRHQVYTVNAVLAFRAAKRSNQ